MTDRLAHRACAISRDAMTARLREALTPPPCSGSLTEDALASEIASVMLRWPHIIRLAERYAAARARAFLSQAIPPACAGIALLTSSPAQSSEIGAAHAPVAASGSFPQGSGPEAVLQLFEAPKRTLPPRRPLYRSAKS